MNIGEASEYYLKSYMLRERDTCLQSTIFKRITELSDDGNLSTLRWRKECEVYLKKRDVSNLVKILNIKKSSTYSKTDISINGKRFSLKETNGAPAAIINHTTRPGFERICNQLGVDISKLDQIMENYWNLRQKSIIKEDTKISDANCPFKTHKDFLKPIINYFIFDGSGSRNSTFPADTILEIDYKNIPRSMRMIGKDDYFKEVWPKLIFSVRSKGMPPSYPNCDNKESIAIWTRRADNLLKGSLHVRVGDNKK